MAPASATGRTTSFFWGGVQLGKPLTPVVHAGIFSGQFEFGANIMPLWQAYTPAPHEQTFTVGSQVYVAPEGGGTYRGVSLTPVICAGTSSPVRGAFSPGFRAPAGLYTPHTSSRRTNWFRMGLPAGLQYGILRRKAELASITSSAPGDQSTWA